MSTGTVTDHDPLEPLRSALVRQAHHDADMVTAAAEEQGRQSVAAAQAEAAALVEQAKTQGESAARALQSHERARLRRAHRGVVLAAERAAYDELTRRACSAVQELLADGENRARLTVLLKRRLGTGASVSDLPDGGLHAEDLEGRSVDAAVSTLVDDALSRLDVSQLWAGP
jgi:hypothetical protein